LLLSNRQERGEKTAEEKGKKQMNGYWKNERQEKLNPE